MGCIFIKNKNRLKNIKPITSDIRRGREDYQKSNCYSVMNNPSYSLDISDIFDIPEKEKRKSHTGNDYSKISKFSKIPKYSENILNEINEARQDCENYSFLVDNLADQIKTNKNQSFLIIENFFEINLIKGKKAFRDCSMHLKDLDACLVDKFRGLKNFEEIEELKVPFPEDEDCDCLDPDYIEQCQIDLVNKIEGKYELVEFVFQITVSDPKIAILLNIVDENTPNKKVRQCLLSEEIKYIGLNSKRINQNLMALYMVFAK